ncbi:MAG: PIN domain-containing protein [Betaproteobacteria bacterium]|nr:PIN domain-containing protein [Betaproteobacteria bacterium]
MKPTNARVFIDTNVFVYLYSGDESAKKAAAIAVLGRGTACVTTQVLGELAHVLTKKFLLPTIKVQSVLHEVCDACEVHPVTPELIFAALRLREQYRYGFYDSLIIAGARMTGSEILYSEDMQQGQVIDGVLAIQSPFVTAAGQRQGQYRVKARRAVKKSVLRRTMRYPRPL